MAITEPTSSEEYERLFAERTRYFGTGLGVGISLPCPFCCAPDFMSYKIAETDAFMKRGATCKACNRSLKAIITAEGTAGRQMEFVQTGGPDCTLSWLPPIRRME